MSAIVVILKVVALIASKTESTYWLEGVAIAEDVETYSITEELPRRTRSIDDADSILGDDPRLGAGQASIESIIIIDARKSISRKHVAASLINPIDIVEIIAKGTLEDVSQIFDIDG